MELPAKLLPANLLDNTNLFVRRSNGKTQANWKIKKPVEFEQHSVGYVVRVSHEEDDLSKLVKVIDLVQDNLHNLPLDQQLLWVEDNLPLDQQLLWVQDNLSLNQELLWKKEKYGFGKKKSSRKAKKSARKTKKSSRK